MRVVVGLEVLAASHIEGATAVDVVQRVARAGQEVKLAAAHGPLIAAIDRRCVAAHIAARTHCVGGDAPIGKAQCATHAPALAHRHIAAQIDARSEEHTSELQSLMRISYAVFCLQQKKPKNQYK